MDDGRRTLVELSRDEALRLLGSAPLGRVVFTLRALPAIRPVNHIMDGDHVIIRTNLGTSVASTISADGEVVVAYQADMIDPDTHTGWSVVATGVARVVRDPHDQARYQRLLHPWVDGPMDCVIRIRADIVTGYRLVDPAALAHPPKASSAER
ncbi:pyridoxamine 5'-phosphate oxidase family protein [Micromonospora sp. NPDC047548]|uniref:pyridoxamine 5'-phosphate oxidase family protein n=1 Tax=Micromonospora sp. NPDC047548 TaxID=3155624 RepID=UPI0033D40013